MFDRRRDGLSQVQNVLVDGGYTGKPFAAVQGLLGASVEVVKRAHLRGASKAVAVFRLAGKVPPTLEELRKEAQYQPATCLHGANQIVNRLLGDASAGRLTRYFASEHWPWDSVAPWHDSARCLSRPDGGH